MMDENLKQHITAKETWLRGLFILLFAFLLTVARVVTWAVVVLQFLFTLVTGRPNENLLSLGRSLAQYIYQCFSYVTFNNDTKPFPFSDWPEPMTLAVASTTNEAANQEKGPGPKKKTSAKKAPRKKASAVKKTAEKNTPAEGVPLESASGAEATEVNKIDQESKDNNPPAANPAKPEE